MKIRVDGRFGGQLVYLEWEDGVVTGNNREAIDMALRIADINVRHGLPTPEDGYIKLEDWMSHPRGFMMCATETLEGATTDWVDEEMKDVILM